MSRRMTAIMLAFGLALAFVPLCAATPSITCGLSGKAHFVPGMTTSLRYVEYTLAGRLANCIGGPSSATVTASGTGIFSCTAGSSWGTAVVYWVSGDSSTVAFNTGSKVGPVRLWGTVSSGLYAGTAITGAMVYEANVSYCVTAELKYANFNGLVRAA